jgi:hypothetical protein
VVAASDRRMGKQHFVHLARIHVVAADDHHVLLAVADEQITVRVQFADVPGI